MTEVIIILGIITVLLAAAVWLGLRSGKASGAAKVSSTELAQADADATLAEQYQHPLTQTDEAEQDKLKAGTF